MQRLYLVVFGTVVLSAVIMAAACLSHSATERTPFTIAWNYDTSGYIETCGCRSHQLGGVARRATRLAALREQGPVLALEGAHLLEDSGEFQLFKAETIVRALNQMDYSALMLGMREAQHGVDGINRLCGLAQFPCFSANLEAGPDAPFVKSTVVTIAGVKVGITGASQWQTGELELPAGVGFSEPRAALDAVLPELRRQCDVLVLCLEGEQIWINDTAKDYRDSADLFLSGDRTKVTAELEYHVDPPLLNNWKYGKYMGVVAVDPQPDGSFSFAGSTIPLEDSIPDDEQVSAMLETEYRAQLKDRFFSQMKVDLEQLYLPPDSCQPCHAQAYESYTGSRHSHAMDTLVEVGHVYNPDCMKCHVVYDPDMDELHSMNCVVCHSNITEQHLWDAVEGNVVKPTVPVTTYTHDFCFQCHDELNSKAFEEYWPHYMYELYHGGDLSIAREAAIEMGIADRIEDLYLDQ